MSKNKLRFIIPLLSLSLLAFFPLIATTCSKDGESISKNQYLKYETKNGFTVISAPSLYGSVLMNQRWWNDTNLLSSLESNGLIDDNFKTKHLGLFATLKKAEDQYSQLYKNSTEEEKIQMLNKINEIRTNIESNWQKENIVLNKYKIFNIVNSFEQLKEISNKQSQEYLKDFDFSSKSILVVNTFDSISYSGSRWLIKNIEIKNNIVNIQFEYKSASSKQNKSKVKSPSYVYTETTHFVVVDKINNLDNYQFNVSNL